MNTLDVLKRNCVWTGDGYVIDKHAIQYSGVSDASVFFNRLAKKPYLSQFLIAPHIYCGEVTGATYGTSGSVLYQKLTTTFGYLTLQGGPSTLLLRSWGGREPPEGDMCFDSPDKLQLTEEHHSYLEILVWEQKWSLCERALLDMQWLGDCRNVIAEDWTMCMSSSSELQLDVQLPQYM